MDVVLKNVKKKDLALLEALAKRLGFEIFVKKENETASETSK
ncbi:hypothetical protein OX283_002835 [Flavobacterium sp. SUN052]|nr:hypothetical protein [Flavobacterium sp. SUN052]MEC4003582.1 hypothetical protein [Flavobacterium sp. SUN052]